MPIEKTANYIRIRVASPKRFIRFRIKELGKGIRAVIGFKKEGGSEIQSLLFPRSKWTLAEAKKWAKEHGYKVSETFYIYDIFVDKDGITFLEETVTEEETKETEEHVDVKKMTKDDFRWLLE